MRKSQSVYELDSNNGMKTKTKSTSSQINQSYSDIDYFPMMSNNNQHQIEKDLYLNPSENYLNYMTIPARQEHQISIKKNSNQQRILNDYKHLDHQRTKALRQTIQQRTQQKTFH